MLLSPDLTTQPIWALYIGVLVCSFLVCCLIHQKHLKLKLITSNDGTKLSVPYSRDQAGITTQNSLPLTAPTHQNITSLQMTGKSSEHKIAMGFLHQKGEEKDTNIGGGMRRNKSCNKFQCLLDKLAYDKDPQTMERNQAMFSNVPVTFNHVGRLESPNAIIPGKLYLGSIYAAHNSAVLKKLGITHILSVCDEHLKVDSQQFVHKVIQVDDKSDVDLLARFEEAHRFIEQGNTLVHCLAGISRSATVTISYIMNKMEKTVAEATEVVHTARSCVRPNAGFLQQLEKYEKLLQTKKLTNIK